MRRFIRVKKREGEAGGERPPPDGNQVHEVQEPGEVYTRSKCVQKRQMKKRQKMEKIEKKRLNEVKVTTYERSYHLPEEMV